MLFRSGDNLENGAIDFINENDEVILFSAYLKLEELKRINTSKKIKEIVVRWELNDLCLGVSDLDVFEYCKENQIILYRNERIHLKAIWNNHNQIFFGSANVTKKGLGEYGKFNYELNGTVNSLEFEDKVYLKNIITESYLINDNLYNKLAKYVLKNSYKNKELPPIDVTNSGEEKFLLSQLPMSSSPSFLLDSIQNNLELTEIDEKCLLNDLVTFKVDSNSTRSEMEEQLKISFNNHPFILALKDHIMNQQNKSLRYGGVVRWIQDNTTTVPTPRSWELKQKKIVNILYEWVCYFDHKFHWNVPGSKSQVIYCK